MIHHLNVSDLTLIKIKRYSAKSVYLILHIKMKYLSTAVLLYRTSLPKKKQRTREWYQDCSMRTNLRHWEELTGKLVDVKVVNGRAKVVVKVERIMEIPIPLETIVFRGVPSCGDDGRGVSILRTSFGYIVRLSGSTLNYLTETFGRFNWTIF